MLPRTISSILSKETGKHSSANSFLLAFFFRKYIPCLYVLNKIDDITIEELDVLDRIPHCVPISSHNEWNLDELLERMWEYLDLVRIYTKPKVKKCHWRWGF